MIELPELPAPNGMTVELVDYGFYQRPASGAGVRRVDRPGSRYRFSFTYPPMPASLARTFTGRLQRGKREGVRVKIPLLGVSQGIPGSPVVDGAGQTGAALSLRGLTPAYVAKEGYWLTIETATAAYIHSVVETGIADGSGDLELEIEPPIHGVLADGDTVHLVEPYVEGFVDGEAWGWSVPVERLIAVQFSLEEFG